MTNYTDPKKAFEDLKERFLHIVYRPDIHKQQQASGFKQANAVQALKSMDDKELLEFANQDTDILHKMFAAAKKYQASDHKYTSSEPSLETGSILERFMAVQRTLKYNNFLLSAAPDSYIVDYNRAIQKMYEHIESMFKRPLVNVYQVERRREMLWGLALANPQQLISLFEETPDEKLTAEVINHKTDNKEYLDSIAETCALITKETCAERTEQQAQENRTIGLATGAAAITTAIATPVVKHYADKEHSSAIGAAGAVSFGIFAAIAAAQLFKHAKKFGRSLEQYANVTNKILTNEKVHSNYYKLKTQKERYQDFSL